jgi:hypothetical protein
MPCTDDDDDKEAGQIGPPTAEDAAAELDGDPSRLLKNAPERVFQQFLLKKITC